MAIKGKGKTKPKQPARAPRRAPVPVKPPFAQRGWVRALAAFLAGVTALAVVWWAWENLDKQHNTKDEAAKQALQRDALSAWGKGNLEPTLSTVGQLQGGGAPQIATSVGPAIDAITKGDDPGVKAGDMTSLADALDTAAGKLDKFKLAEAITDHGFDKAQTDVITTVQSEIAEGLRSYAVAARLTARAIEDPAAAEDLAAAAKEAFDTGQALVQRGWNSYTNVTAAAGVPLQVPQGLGTGG
jgi:hypothetical protein